MTRPLDILRAHGVVAAAEPHYTREIGQREVVSALKHINFIAVPRHSYAVFTLNGTLDERVSVHVSQDAVFVRALDMGVVNYQLPLGLAELKHVIDAASTLSQELVDVVEQANAKVDAESRRVMAVITKVKPTKRGLSLHYADGFTLAPA